MRIGISQRVDVMNPCSLQLCQSQENEKLCSFGWLAYLCVHWMVCYMEY